MGIVAAWCRGEPERPAGSAPRVKEVRNHGGRPQVEPMEESPRQDALEVEEEASAQAPKEEEKDEAEEQVSAPGVQPSRRRFAARFDSIRVVYHSDAVASGTRRARDGHIGCQGHAKAIANEKRGELRDVWAK